ncbi:MAG TPA: POT family MFS transporter [Bacteroidia bacterium]|nr:POT family MFS transporter [Bacteroidia bacterium]
MAEAITKKSRFPKSIPYIIGNEAAERFSFYGMKTLLATFFVHQFLMSDAQSNAKTHLFISITYLMSILGGVLADWYLGKYKTIFWLSLLYCVGHAFLSAFDTQLNLFMLGLLFITIGAGGIKPCVSANVGDQFDHTNQDLISKMFNWFYFAINAGSTVSTLLTPILMLEYGASVAFGVPGILMALATFVFWLGRKKYVYVPPSGYVAANFIAINFYALFNPSKKKEKGESWLDAAKTKFSDESVENMKAVWSALAVFAFFPIFWALYDQNGSEWVLQATKMNLHFMGYTWLPEQIQAINPILILAFIPLFSYLIYPAVEKLGIKVTPLRKIGAGLVVMAITFMVIASIQTKIDAGGQPNIVWQLLAYTLLTASEIMVSITGLEYAYTQAPKSMKSTIMAFFLATVFVGDMFDTLVNMSVSKTGWLSSFADAKGMENAKFYWFFFIILSAFTLLFIIVSKNIKEKSYLIDDPNLVPAEIDSAEHH